MTNRQTIWAQTLLILAIVAAILLASGLSELNFLPGGVLGLPQAGQGGDGALSQWLDRNLGDLSSLVSGIMVILMPVSILLLIVSPEARKLFKQYMLMLSPLFIFALFFLSRRGGAAPEAGEDAAPVSVADSVEIALPPTILNDPPEWLVYLSSFLVVFATLLAGLYIYNRFLRPSTLDQLAQEAQDALDELQAGGDLSNTIKRCYFDMSRVLRNQRGIRRKQEMTAREFEQKLKSSGLPFTHIQQLTRLFESVRYGAKTPDETQENLAVECLQAIVHAAEKPLPVELA
jgi:hypothetical protein